MKQSPLKRGKPMGRSQPKRDWTEARAKVEREADCRLRTSFLRSECGCGGPNEAAHIVGREHDKHPPHIPYADGLPNVTRAYPWEVAPVRIVPLCNKHHRAYDAHELDLLPYLTVEEQAQAVLDAGGIELARRRICGAYPQGDGS